MADKKYLKWLRSLSVGSKVCIEQTSPFSKVVHYKFYRVVKITPTGRLNLQSISNNNVSFQVMNDGRVMGRNEKIEEVTQEVVAHQDLSSKKVMISHYIHGIHSLEKFTVEEINNIHKVIVGARKRIKESN